MSDTNWTPGPWHVELDFDGDGPVARIWSVSVEDAKGVGVWFCAGFLPDETDEIIANAHVTAAAPDMYRCLAGIARILSGRALLSDRAALRADIEAILKKAEGER